MSDTLILAEDVGKKFCRDLRRSLYYGARDCLAAINPWFDATKSLATLRENEFWANEDISFEVRRGECLGLIGPNGAGKTTLLRMIGNLIQPDRGRIVTYGSVGGLIALEAGFNPILTGRENVVVNGSILGIPKKQVRQRLDEIVAFADLEHAIDAPVQTYSSGMRVRLGFATAVCLIQPDVLLLDEVLAVGDAAFRAKCYNAVANLRESTATIFVSHSMAMISSTADRGLVLDNGQSVCHGSISEAIQHYEALNRTADVDAKMLRHDGIDAAAMEIGAATQKWSAPLQIMATIDASERFEDCFFDIVFYDRAGEIVGHYNGDQNGERFAIHTGQQTLRCRIGGVNLAAGSYHLGVVIRCLRTRAVLVWSYKEHQVEMTETLPGFCSYQMS